MISKLYEKYKKKKQEILYNQFSEYFNKLEIDSALFNRTCGYMLGEY